MDMVLIPKFFSVEVSKYVGSVVRDFFICS